MSTNKSNPTPFIFIGNKKPQYYRNFLIMADTNLHDQVFELIKNNTGKAKRILVLGSGQGAMDQRLKDYGYEVLSSDIDKDNFKANTELHVMDFNDFDQMHKFASLYKNKFDLVLSMEIVEHIENIHLYFDVVNKVLKKGGKFIITTPNVTSWISRIQFLVKGELFSFSNQTFIEYGHVNPISELELKTILNQKGFILNDMLRGGLLPKLWIVTNIKALLYNILGFILRFFMKGNKDGWCIICTAIKS